MKTRSVRRTVLWSVGSLGLVAVLTVAVLFVITTRLQRQLNERTAELLIDETIGETAMNVAHQQMLMAVRYVYTPDPAVEAQFRELGQEFYRLLREYLRRDLSMGERRRVERIKEAHEQLEVYAFDAFSYARAGQPALARERNDRVARNADYLQQEITAFLVGRRPERQALEDQFRTAMGRVYIAAAIGLLLLLLATLAITRHLRNRLVQPLQELGDAAARVAPGTPPLQVEPSSVVEIHEVAESFRQMSARLLVAQEQTEEAHRKFTSLVASVDAIVWEAEAYTFRPIFVSAYAETLLGYPLADWIGKPQIWRRVIHPDDYERVVRECNAAADRGDGHELEYRLVTRAGNVLWVRDLIRVASNGGPKSLRGVIFNITAQRAYREALQHSEERFRALIENASDTVTVLDARGATIYSGPSLTKVLGYDPAEREGRSVLEIVHPDDVAHARELLQAALERRVDDVVVNVRARHADGSWRWLEVKARNLLDHPAVRGLVMNSADITERKEAQLALAASEEQLRQSQKMEAIGRLAAGVAHDFNNILTAIHGYLDLAFENPTTQPIREDLIQIKVAADRAVDLTKQLLAFGRKQMLQPEVLDICQAVRDIQRMLARLIGETIEFNVYCEARGAHVKVDRGQLHQMLMNLAVNARDAMPKGGTLTITVTAQSGATLRGTELPEGNYVGLKIADTGVGMDREVAERIFDPFFTTKPVGEGTGLGLSTVYGIVKQSGGHIAVESERGAGTTFSIWLPQAEAASAEAGAREAAFVPHTARAASILVAEDEKAVRALIERMLRKHGYRVTAVPDGRAAIEHLERHAHEIDLVIADMVMPHAGGADVAEAAARIAPAMPVILMSGYSEEEILEHARGINPRIMFVGKPYSASQMLRSIDWALEGSDAKQA